MVAMATEKDSVTSPPPRLTVDGGGSSGSRPGTRGGGFPYGGDISWPAKPMAAYGKLKIFIDNLYVYNSFVKWNQRDKLN